jgi:hypothetical protein
VAIGSLADYLVAGPFQERAQTFAHNLVVIGQ